MARWDHEDLKSLSEPELRARERAEEIKRKAEEAARMALEDAKRKYEMERTRRISAGGVGISPPGGILMPPGGGIFGPIPPSPLMPAWPPSELDALKRDVAAFKERIEELLKALQFYSNEANWQDLCSGVMVKDRGRIAKAAILGVSPDMLEDRANAPKPPAVDEYL